MTLSCGAGLPGNFRELSLEQQIQAYEKFFEDGGLSSYEAPGVISSRGYPAAEAMVPYLTGADEGIPVEEAVYIVWYVQLRGCRLKGTRAEAALRSLASRELEEPLHSTVESALEAITDDIQMPRHLDQFGASDCGPGAVPIASDVVHSIRWPGADAGAGTRQLLRADWYGAHIAALG
jgi:hypothetical protein